MMQVKCVWRFAAAAVQQGGDSLCAACCLSVFEVTSVVDEKLFGFSS
jgi:hypothetical protein